MKKRNQEQILLNILQLSIKPQSVKSLTHVCDFGDIRKRISDLRAKGHPIEDMWVNEPTRHKVYWLKGEIK